MELELTDESQNKKLYDAYERLLAELDQELSGDDLTG